MQPYKPLYKTIAATLIIALALAFMPVALATVATRSYALTGPTNTFDISTREWLIDRNDGNPFDDFAEWDGETLAVYSGANIAITGASYGELRIEVNGSATITLDAVVIAGLGDNESPLKLSSGTNLTLMLAAGTVNSLTAGQGGAGIHAPAGTTLTIGGAGSLSAFGAMRIHDPNLPGTGTDDILPLVIESGAGIGGINGGSGQISILDGAKVTAAGGSGSAGIGGGLSGNGGTTEISGDAEVTAMGGVGGAGVGGGHSGSGGLITISGAVVSATGGDGAIPGNSFTEGWTGPGTTGGGAGIGGGMDGPGGMIYISDGIVTARGGDSIAYQDDNGSANIGSGGAGIGGGGSSVYIASLAAGSSASGGSVIVNGGFVFATGGEGVYLGNESQGIGGSAGSGIGIGGLGYGQLIFYGGASAQSASASFGMDGNGIVFASSVTDQSPKKEGILFNGFYGTVYGNVTLENDLTIEPLYTLTIPNGSTLTVPSGITLMNKGTIVGESNIIGAISTDPTNDPPLIATQSLPGGTYNTPYSEALSAGGIEVKWSIESGSLPAGLSLNPDTGVISGTPEAAGDFAFTVKTENAVGNDEAELSIIIAKASQTVPEIIDGNISKVYGDSPFIILASGGAGTGAYVFEISNADIASIDQNGRVTLSTGADAIGLAEITATRLGDDNYEESGKSAAITLTVDKAQQAPPVITHTREGSPDGGGVTVTITSPGEDAAEFSLDSFSSTSTSIITFGPGTAETVIYARLKETDTHNQSESVSVKISFAKLDRSAPQQFYMSHVYNEDERHFAVTIPETAGAEYSFDGIVWGEERTTAANPGDTVIGYVRYPESDTHNASPQRASVLIVPYPATAVAVFGNLWQTAITVNGGTLQMYAAVQPSGAAQSATWSVVSGNASISGTGLLTASGNGEATVRATAADGTGIYGETIITISGQQSGSSGSSGYWWQPPAPRHVFADGSSTYTHGTSTGITFTVQKSFSAFRDIIFNGTQLVRGSDYTALNGSIVITLLPGYLDALTIGQHRFTVRFNDGTEPATVTITVEESIEAPNLWSASGWAYRSINEAYSLSLIPEQLLSDYANTMTRAEFCALAVALYEAVSDEIEGRSYFIDTDDINVEKMAAVGVVYGVGGGKFAPDSLLTREQAATMLARLAAALGNPLPSAEPSFADSENISAWAFRAAGQVQAAEIMEGVGSSMFSPKGNYQRQQAIATMLRLYGIVV